QQQQIMSAVVDVTKLSWAPEIELEVQRYREEAKKLRQDEDRLMEARRKSRFELERASWDVERQDHLVGLVLGQLEELDREVEMTDHLGGDHTESSSLLDITITMNDMSDRNVMSVITEAMAANRAAVGPTALGKSVIILGAVFLEEIC
ncbi:hypothetical protein BGX30_010420, partial [Mortierella sp. GBA39]